MNEPAFLRSIKQKMIERFQHNWRTKLASSNSFLCIVFFKSYHLAETYVNDVTIKKVPKLRFGINELGINKRSVPENSPCRDCPCRGNLEDEPHFLLHCPVYSEIRRKYISEFIGQDTDTLDI